jgi:hypothetical protein
LKPFYKALLIALFICAVIVGAGIISMLFIEPTQSLEQMAYWIVTMFALTGAIVTGTIVLASESRPPD